MGVTLYIEGYKKEPSCISGFIQCLGWYEVNLTQIQPYRLSKNFVAFRWGIQSIEELMEMKSAEDYGFYSRDEFDFYLKASEFFLRYENENVFGLMFEPKPIWETLQKLLAILPDLKSNLSDLKSEQMEFYEEEVNLEKLKKLLEETIEKEGIISCRLG
jgi:hypothetical protein